jgi:hypothetical protein
MRATENIFIALGEELRNTTTDCARNPGKLCKRIFIALLNVIVDGLTSNAQTLGQLNQCNAILLRGCFYIYLHNVK